MKRWYCFAGVEYELHIPDEKIYVNERNFTSFAVDKVTNPYRFYFEAVEVLDEPVGNCIVAEPDFRIYYQDNLQIRYIGMVLRDWKNACIRVERKENIYWVQMKKDTFQECFGIKWISKTLDAVHLIAKNNGILLHCSFIEYQGKAILFTAPSGTGKSTQADIWSQYMGADIINGDRAAVKICGDKIYAEGVPFSGSSKICKNQKLPLAAIVYLGQSSKTTIQQLRGYRAFQKIWEGCSVNMWNQKDVLKASEIVATIVKDIPIFYLLCTPDYSAVEALQEQFALEVRS